MASHHNSGDKVDCCSPKFAIFLLGAVALVCFAGLMAGLTLGLMSLGLVDLEVLIKSGRPQDRIHATKIFPVVKNQHLLLCTLLIGNSLAMEALPVCLDALVPNWAAILISVTLILMFGEILPQAVCSRYGLKVGAAAAPFVRVLLWLFYPVAYPISKVLDWMLGKGHAVLLRRAELKTFVDFHGNEAGKGGDLTHDETTIIAGALELTEKTVKDAMTPISKAFSLDLDANLNLETLNAIMSAGHSRVPVYHGNPTNIIGLILLTIEQAFIDLACNDWANCFELDEELHHVAWPRNISLAIQLEFYDLHPSERLHSNHQVKNLLSVDPKDAVPLRKMIIRRIPRVSGDMPLYDILNEFQKGHSHIAVVYKDDRKDKIKDGQLPEFKGRCKKPRHKPEISQRKDNSDDGSPATDQNLEVMDSKDTQAPVTNSNGGQQRKKSPPGTPTFKKRHTGCSHCILDIENAPLPTFPSNEEVVGVITMEDVIEELLQEEILDETDEYVNIHNRIKINMHNGQENDSGLDCSQPSSTVGGSEPAQMSKTPTAADDQHSAIPNPAPKSDLSSTR